MVRNFFSTKNGASSLKLAGYHWEAFGLPLHPIPGNELMITYVKTYLESLCTNCLNAPLLETNEPPLLTVELLEENTAVDRYRNWNRRKKLGTL